MWIVDGFDVAHGRIGQFYGVFIWSVVEISAKNCYMGDMENIRLRVTKTRTEVISWTGLFWRIRRVFIEDSSFCGSEVVVSLLSRKPVLNMFLTHHQNRFCWQKNNISTSDRAKHFNKRFLFKFRSLICTPSHSFSNFIVFNSSDWLVWSCPPCNSFSRIFQQLIFSYDLFG